MSGEAIGWAFRKVQMDDATAKFVLVGICNYANDEDQAWPSHASLAKITGLSRSTIQSAVKRLEGWGIINRVSRTRENGSETSAKVFIDIDSHWIVKDGTATKATGGIPAAGTQGVQQPVQGIPAAGTPETTSKPQKEIGELPLGAPAPSGDLEKQFFDRAVQIITSSPKDARSTAASLRKACGMDIAKARSALELSAGKSDPAHWIRGHIAWLKKKSNEPTDSTVLMSGADDRHVLM